MAKQNPENMESLPQWDDGTYQTGSTTPPKSASPMVTMLLVSAIFLVGLVSGLGLINVRQLLQAIQDPGATIHASHNDFTLPTLEGPLFSDNNTPAPAIPLQRSVKLQMVQSPAYSDQISDQFLANGTAVYQANRQSLVEIYTLSHSNSTQSSVGVILTADGYLLANAHMVEAAKRIFVYLPDGRLLPASVVGSDNMTDMAVLYVEAQGLTPATFGTSRTLQVDDPIYTVSLQDDVQMPMLMYEGNLFAPSRKFSTQHYYLNLLQTCHHSESGPMFNRFGQVVGLCVSRTAQYFGESENLGVVLGSNSMQVIIDQLVENGHVAGRPDLGFEVEAVSKLFQHYWQLPGGLMVSGVEPESEPARQGLRNGDIILALDGRALNTRDDLYTVLFSCAIGQKITAVLFRDGDKVTVELTVSQLGA